MGGGLCPTAHSTLLPETWSGKEKHWPAAPCHIPKPGALVWRWCRAVLPMPFHSSQSWNPGKSWCLPCFPQTETTLVWGRRGKQGRKDYCRLNTCTVPSSKKISCGLNFILSVTPQIFQVLTWKIFLMEEPCFHPWEAEWTVIVSTGRPVTLPVEMECLYVAHNYLL